ncbi:MAG: glycine cleavage system aminomethyltransferase GcvT, partial [Gemmatimonadaceae bacterium]
MDASSTGMLKRTPFHDMHVALGAKMVPFAGYDMPVQYPTGITVEHKAVRESCGLFDVSHRGEFLVRGPGAVDFVNHVTTNNVAALEVGQVQYSGILNERGTFEDDCLVYRDADSILMVVNASNAAKDFAHISQHLSRFDCTLDDVGDDVALLALQGPAAKDVLQAITDVDLSTIKYYFFEKGTVAGAPDV